MGIIKSGELLLRRDDANQFAREAADIGVAVIDGDGWKQLAAEGFVEMVGIFFGISTSEYDALPGEALIQRCLEIMREFMESSLSQEADFIALRFDIDFP